MARDFLEFDAPVFLFGKKRPETGSVRRPVPTDQKRQAYRASFEFPILYTLGGRDGTRNATANDLSVGGLRLVGDEDLPNDTLVDFRFTLPNELIAGVEIEKIVNEVVRGKKTVRRIMVPPEPFLPMTLHGKSVITFLNVRRRKFMHGVQFAGIDHDTTEEIQRFIHVWQIRQLRERALMRDD